MVADEPNELTRRRLRELRRRIPLDEVARRSSAAAGAAVLLPWWEGVRSVGVFISFDGELDTEPLIAACRSRGVATYAPRLDGNHLVFVEFTEHTPWESNRYGIDEPMGTATVAVESLDLVFVPSVAVDRRGNRLGMGAGWYDRTFSGLGEPPRGSGPKLIAYVHDEQVVESIDPQDWDVAVDAVVTPAGAIITYG